MRKKGSVYRNTLIYVNIYGHVDFWPNQTRHDFELYLVSIKRVNARAPFYVPKTDGGIEARRRQNQIGVGILGIKRLLSLLLFLMLSSLSSLSKKFGKRRKDVKGGMAIFFF